MSPDQKRLWAVITGLLAAFAALLLLGRARQRLAPEPRVAYVAIEPEGSGVATVGPVTLPANRRFDLRAVVEVETWRGGTAYWTEAERLRIGDREIPASALGRYAGGDRPRLLWFTVEGLRPYLEVEGDEPPLEFREVFRAAWPHTWTVPGTVAPNSPPPGLDVGGGFGTQRYHVRLELYGPESTIRPRLRVDSAGAAALPRDATAFPTVTATLDGNLEEPSAVFGLPQFERLGVRGRADGLRLREWIDARLAFTRLSLIQRTLARAGVGWEALDWRAVELDGSAPWGEVGSLLRAGVRVVHLFRDRGAAGRLDDEDLCFDFDRGAAVRRLGDIFTGDGLVEVARLPGADDPTVREGAS